MALPDWLFLWYAKALVGDIFPSVRAIALGFDHKRKLTVRYLLDREPEDDDYERIETTLTDVLANTSSNDEIPEVAVEAMHHIGAIGSDDILDGLVFCRAEDEPST